MNLHAGCGFNRLPEPWLNVDIQPDVGPDMVVDVRSMPFGDGDFEQSYAGHLVEHVPKGDIIMALSELFRVTKGVVLLIGPDLETWSAAWAAGEIESDHYRLALLGGRRYVGDEHWWVPTPESLAYFVDTAGRIPLITSPRAAADKGWPVVNPDDPYQVAIEALR